MSNTKPQLSASDRAVLTKYFDIEARAQHSGCAVREMSEDIYSLRENIKQAKTFLQKLVDADVRGAQIIPAHYQRHHLDPPTLVRAQRATAQEADKADEQHQRRIDAWRRQIEVDELRLQMIETAMETEKQKANSFRGVRDSMKDELKAKNILRESAQ